MLGTLLFLAASAACGLAPSVEALVAARVLQGSGSAGIMSVNTALVRTICPTRDETSGSTLKRLARKSTSRCRVSSGSGSWGMSSSTRWHSPG